MRQLVYFKFLSWRQLLDRGYILFRTERGNSMTLFPTVSASVDWQDLTSTPPSTQDRQENDNMVSIHVPVIHGPASWYPILVWREVG